MESINAVNKEKLEKVKLQYPISTKIKAVSYGEVFGTVCGTDNKGFLLVRWDNGDTSSIDPDTNICIEEEKNKVWICSYYLEDDGDDANITVWDNFDDAVNEMTATLKKIYDDDFTINDFYEDPKEGYLLTPLLRDIPSIINDYDRYAIIPYCRNSGKFIMP